MPILAVSVGLTGSDGFPSSMRFSECALRASQPTQFAIQMIAQRAVTRGKGADPLLQGFPDGSPCSGCPNSAGAQ